MRDRLLIAWHSWCCFPHWACVADHLLACQNERICRAHDVCLRREEGSNG